MRTLLDLVGWNVTRPLIVFEKEPGFSGGGGSPSPSSVVKSAAQGIKSVTQDPAVAKTGADKGTQKRGSSPKPPKRPSALDKKVYDATGKLARDLNMGFSTLFQSKEKQAETLKEKGYSDDVIKDYQERTERDREERLASLMSRSDDDKRDSSPAPVASAPSAPSAPTTTTPTPTPPPAPAPIGEDMSAPEAGSAEEEVVEGAKKRKGRASTIETTTQGLLTEPKTRRRRSLMGGLIS